MLRIDARKPEEAAELIRWAQRDEFWMGNVLSMGTFRKQFDRLALKSTQEAKGRTNGKGAVPAPLPANYVSASEQIRREQQRQAAVVQ